MAITNLYLHNYKGFQQTFIELADVNFFVGENSTGKSAVLDLLSIITEPTFMMNPNLNIPGKSIGFFKEYMKQNTNGEHEFYIGFEDNIRMGNKLQTKRHLFTFKNSNEVPVVRCYRCTRNGRDVIITFSKNGGVSYKYRDINEELNFREWVIKDFNDYRSGSLRSIIGRSSIPFAVANSLVFAAIEENFNSENSITGVRISTSLRTPETFKAMAPIRAYAQRFYEGFHQQFSAEGLHTPLILRDLLSANGDPAFRASIEAFGHDSGLFDALSVKELGTGKTVPFRIKCKYGHIESEIINVGFGVPQVLPLAVEMLRAKRTMFALQQPEVHLHPKAQAAFGQLVYDSFKHNKNKFAIETHSDYIIDRFRYRMSIDDSVDKPSAQTLFFERNESGTQVTSISIDNNGAYSSEQPTSFREFFINEGFQMLQV